MQPPARPQSVVAHTHVHATARVLQSCVHNKARLCCSDREVWYVIITNRVLRPIYALNASAHWSNTKIPLSVPYIDCPIFAHQPNKIMLRCRDVTVTQPWWQPTAKRKRFVPVCSPQQVSGLSGFRTHALQNLRLDLCVNYILYVYLGHIYFVISDVSRFHIFINVCT